MDIMKLPNLGGLFMQKGLTGNHLKLLAVIFMTIDHIGAILFPEVLWLRVIGRLAYPIFAYMIAEGCTHTRSMLRYFATMAAMATVCQVTMYIVTGSLYQYILVTFTLSIGMICLLKQAMNTRHIVWYVLSALGVITVWLLTQYLPIQLKHTGFSIDYSFWGVMLPVTVWLCKTRGQKLVATAAVLVLISGKVSSIQMLSLGALPLLMMYNGQRGTRKLKYFFYLYFSGHIVLLELIASIIK